MAPTRPDASNMPSDDELDDILKGIVEGRDIPRTNDEQAQSSLARQKSGTAGNGLGIDEEIIITKKRTPIPKLDDNRLLSDPGIPRLQRISKERLRFKGKGHEYGDIARMLNMYQLWLDDLYPRAKFADALAIIEKVGHTKRMQMMRKGWIDEGKPRRTTEWDDEDGDEVVPEGAAAGPTSQAVAGIEQSEETRRAKSHGLAAVQDRPASGSAGADPSEDELDALLAESAQHQASITKTLPVRTASADDDPFADEMEAMADMDDMW
ncbi:chromosome segregation in meiosis protein 3 [Ampelomyces quisqualis]|uniref:Chromosome segregation in meiosis protein n=1 Tax=Ampelomyces quisqualis TaxID=50730 RepID=A0A6A5QZR9_AMPQU|nr:chromosome segregation in meiosis protein 3 [Ampelomyces quisqualis]